MSTKERAYELFQTIYYDSIDRGDMKNAVTALHDDVEWSHMQVWVHHNYTRDHGVSELRGRAAVDELLSERVDNLADTKIEHKVRNMVFEDDKGAFLAEVVGPDKSVPFFVWFELKDDLVYRYLLRPL